MTTQEIQEYIEAAISAKFDGYNMQSEEVMIREGGGWQSICDQIVGSSGGGSSLSNGGGKGEEDIDC